MMKSVTPRYLVYLTTIIVMMISSLMFGCQRGGGQPIEDSRAVRILSTVAYEKVSKGLVLQDTPLTNVRFLQTLGLTPTSLTGATPFLGNRAADGSITWIVTTPTYDRTDKNVHFVAYHPQGTETTNTQALWTIDGKTDILLSAPWDAGKYSAPKTGTGAGETPLTFDHALAQLALVFKAEADADQLKIEALYGKITAIKLYQTLPKATYTYATNKVTFSGTKVDMPLLGPDCQTTFSPIAVPTSSNVAVNAGGLFASSTGSFTLLIATEKFALLPVVVQLTGTGGNRDFEVGKKHTVTITFKANRAELVVSGSSIVDWSAQYTAGADVAI